MEVEYIHSLSALGHQHVYKIVSRRIANTSLYVLRLMSIRSSGKQRGSKVVFAVHVPHSICSARLSVMLYPCCIQVSHELEKFLKSLFMLFSFAKTFSQFRISRYCHTQMHFIEISQRCSANLRKNRTKSRSATLQFCK